MSVSKCYAHEHIYWIATPDELEALLTQEGFHLLKVNSHVSMNYTESPLSDFMQPYRTLYGLLRAGERLTWDEHWHLFRNYNPTKDISRCIYGNEHTYQGERYKTADLDYLHRSVNMGPFVLYKEAKKDNSFSISKTYSYTQFPESTVGIEFSCSTKRYTWDVPEPETSLKDSPEYKDFLFIKSYIRAITKPLKIQIGERIVNTGIRASEAAKADARNFYFFNLYFSKENGFTIL